MDKSELDRIWERFVQLSAIKAFGEKAVIADGVRQRNFLGSVELHKALFDQAVSEILSKP